MPEVTGLPPSRGLVQVIQGFLGCRVRVGIYEALVPACTCFLLLLVFHRLHTELLGLGRAHGKRKYLPACPPHKLSLELGANTRWSSVEQAHLVTEEGLQVKNCTLSYRAPPAPKFSEGL